MSAALPGEVILVHGLWYGSWAMMRLNASLRDRGFHTRLFEYPSTSASLEEHAEQLARFIQESDREPQHFVGHSLGGMVILRAFHDHALSRPGRILLLGSPIQGSVTARRTRRVPGSGLLMGRVRSALEQGFAELPGDREIGMIAGSRGVGLGLLVGGVGGPGDGTVGVSETQCGGINERLLLPVTHTGLLFSRQVARQSACFLRTGRFEHADESSDPVS